MTPYNEAVSNVNSMVSMVNDTPNVNISHVDAKTNKRLAYKWGALVQVKLELVNTGVENVAKTQKKLIQE